MPNKFLSAADVLQGNGYMNYVNHTTLKENNKEFILNTLWEVSFTQVPAAVYYPGDSIIFSRLTGFTPSIDSAITGVEAVIRGFTIMQKTSQKTNGTLSMDFMDREDQAISVFIYDWGTKISDPDTKFSFRKEDTVAEITQTIFNTSRQPIRSNVFYNFQPTTNGGLKEDGVSDPDAGNNSEVTIEGDFEHYKKRFLNI